MSQPLTWVVGGRGLLGSAVTRALLRRSNAGPANVWVPPPVHWQGTFTLNEIRSHTREFSSVAGTGSWQILWCAGAGVTATTVESFRSEFDALGALLNQLGELDARFRGSGSIFVASSAGALYAGADGAPFTELDDVRPLAAYGEAKLRMEKLALSWSEQTAIPLLVGRISNLYGPGQNLTKPQGLISQICRAHLLRRPISIYVSLDTVRDYIYVDDCAELILASMQRMRAVTANSGAHCHTKILASQHAITVGAVISELRRVIRQQPKIIYSRSPLTPLQTRDLRMRSVIWPDLDRHPLTPLPVGIWRTVDALSRSLQLGALV